MRDKRRQFLDERRREFIFELADALDGGRKIKALLVRLEPLADPEGNRGIAQLTRQLQAIVQNEVGIFSAEVVEPRMAGGISMTTESNRPLT